MAEVDKQVVLFDDLHTDNLLTDGQGQPFIVDASARILSESEVDLVRGEMLG